MPAGSSSDRPASRPGPRSASTTSARVAFGPMPPTAKTMHRRVHAGPPAPPMGRFPRKTAGRHGCPPPTWGRPWGGDSTTSPTEARMLQIFTSPLPALGVGGVLPAEDWSTFLDAVSWELAGSPVIVDVTSRDDARAVVARGVLHALMYDARGDVIEVAVRIPTPGRIS